MRALADALRTIQGPIVVMGDMNAPRVELAPLVAVGLEPSPRRHRTLSKPWRRRQIDHVLAGRGARVLTSETIRSDASDHLALAADLETLVVY
jgi:endonuclease/exonuclease/phosphatase (EEP) superfamily protein YafD